MTLKVTVRARLRVSRDLLERKPNAPRNVLTIAGDVIVSHEAAEWMDDPYVVNNTPPWGNTGQVAGCQGNLEVGDPLTGSLAPRIFMPNGYTYSLQELADFSWFFGKPSLGIHGWFSDNGTFLTDAGPPCH